MMKTEVFNHPRPARTPPSTFLFLHLYLSNSPDPKIHPHINESLQTHPTTNNNRQLSAVYSLISMRNVTGHLVASAVGQSSAALSGCLIGPADRTCQRRLSTNRRIGWKNPATPENHFLSIACVALESPSADDHSPDHAFLQ